MKYFFQLNQLIVVFAFMLNIFSINAKTYNVKQFGAKGDGVSDDYYALLSVVKKINQDGGGKMYFPPGTYYIDQYHSGVGQKENLTFLNCKGLKIYGKKATISVKGDYHRKTTRKSHRFSFSSHASIIPIFIENCEDVKIKNIEINGNVDKMTRDKVLAETASHLVIIKSSKNVVLKNLFLHHAGCDGLVFREGKMTNENINCYNVVCSNNARLGVTIGALKNAVFKKCSFINTGYTDGKYVGHLPMAGMDIEPNSRTSTVKDITFENCRFENNKHSQMVLSHVSTTSDVTFKQCSIVSNANNHRYSVIVNSKNIVFDSCLFTLKGLSAIYPMWHNDGASSSYYNCVIKAEGRGMVGIDSPKAPNNNVIVSGCTFEYIGNTPVKSYMPYLRIKNLDFVNNKIIIPEKYLKKSGVNSLIQNAKKVQGNQYYSDGKLVKNPKVSYYNSNVLD